MEEQVTRQGMQLIMTPKEALRVENALADINADNGSVRAGGLTIDTVSERYTFDLDASFPQSHLEQHLGKGYDPKKTLSICITAATQVVVISMMLAFMFSCSLHAQVQEIGRSIPTKLHKHEVN